MADLDDEDDKLVVTHDVDDSPVRHPDAGFAIAALEHLGPGWARIGTERLDPVADAAPRQGIERSELPQGGRREDDLVRGHRPTTRVRASPSPTGRAYPSPRPRLCGRLPGRFG